MKALHAFARWCVKYRIVLALQALTRWCVKYRVALVVGVFQTIAIVLLERWDHTRSTSDYYTKGAPFLLVSVFGYLLIFTLLTQEKRRNGPWWRFWDRLDPWTIGFIAYLVTVTGYTSGLFSGFGTPFQVPVKVYDYLRIGLFLSGFFGVPLTSLLLEYRWRAWRDRVRDRPELLDDHVPDGMP